MSLEEALAELPTIFRYHVFCCSTQRPAGHPRGSCGERGSSKLWERLGQLVQSKQLTDVSVVPTGCLGFCSAGPLMVVYPEGIWYVPRTLDDIDRIVSSHFIESRPVEDLIVVLQR